MESLNHTFIVLIPKVDNPFKVLHYQPISLCNVSYKIIATRLKSFLPHMISEQQLAFVPSRLIQDNSIMAHEIFHVLSHKKRKKKWKLCTQT